MNTELPHECVLGVLDCTRHPRWRVARPWSAWAGVSRPWEIYSPGSATTRSKCAGRYKTFDEAIRAATERSRAEKLAAIQDGAA